jgi:leukotriene-A4 hydrolase
MKFFNWMKVYLIVVIGIWISLSANAADKIPVASQHSFANPQQAYVTHLDWNAAIDFNTQQISATAIWDIKIVDQDAKEIIFDTRGLAINLGAIKVNGKPVKAFLEPMSELAFMGQALHVPIHKEAKKVEILYHTTDASQALQWVEPTQTHSKTDPFLYTQSEAALARSWVPCQDAPGIRFTYAAHLSVPAGFLALMSVGNNAKSTNSKNEYNYQQTHPIPSYLLALAVGKLRYMPYSNSECGIYAEETFASTVYNEFDAMPSMVKAASKLYGKYAWGRFDVIVLPPSFPFGGMENPNLTFATPTVVTGKKDLVNLVAHELAHSWSGNLVTNATWNDFWLNEGFTMYVEQRIMEELYGRDFAEMQAALDVNDVKVAIQDFGEKSPDTHLKLNLANRDPDEGMTDIAYDKGYLFLRMLEEYYGRQKWDAFLKSYFTSHAFSSLTTEDFLAYLSSQLVNPEPLVAPEQTAWRKLRIDEWVYGPGLPSNTPVVVAKRFNSIDSVMEIVSKSDNFNLNTIPKKDWTTFEWLRFLQAIDPKTDKLILQKLDETYLLTGTDNAEIATDWYLLCLRANYESAFPAMKMFLGKVGRRKFLMPLYFEMNKSDAGKVMALEIYKNSKSVYHSVSRNTISNLLQTDY